MVSEDAGKTFTSVVESSRIHGDHHGLWINPANHKKLETGLTGVLRSHRRKGLALAMKLHVIRFAQEFGAEVIETENEENNPMYNINMLLGFQPRPAWLDFLKKMEE